MDELLADSNTPGPLERTVDMNIGDAIVMHGYNTGDGRQVTVTIAAIRVARDLGAYFLVTNDTREQMVLLELGDTIWFPGAYGQVVELELWAAVDNCASLVVRIGDPTWVCQQRLRREKMAEAINVLPLDTRNEKG